MSKEALFREIIRRQQIQYAYCNQDRQLLDFSDGLLDLANQPLLVGAKLERLFDELTGLETHLDDVQAGIQPPFQIEKTWHQLPNGRSGYFTFSISPYQGGLLLIISDVTPHAQIEQSLMQQRNEVKLLNHRLDLVRLRLQALLSRFMPPEVSQQLLDDPHTNTQSSQQATVLFSDLLGFTPWTQELNDDDILDLLNDALNGAVKTVTSAGGVLDQYVGDAVLGIFNVIADAPDHAFQAIYAAWQFIQVMQKVDAFEFSIGISTDRAAVGVIDNDDQASYTAVGPAVSQAKQLQEIAQAHQIVISATTYALVQDRVDVQLAGSQLLAGRKLSGDVYVVTAIRS